MGVGGLADPPAPGRPLERCPLAVFDRPSSAAANGVVRQRALLRLGGNVMVAAAASVTAPAVHVVKTPQPGMLLSVELLMVASTCSGIRSSSHGRRGPLRQCRLSVRVPSAETARCQSCPNRRTTPTGPAGPGPPAVDRFHDCSTEHPRPATEGGRCPSPSSGRGGTARILKAAPHAVRDCDLLPPQRQADPPRRRGRPTTHVLPVTCR
jgi:hypothetical protein